MQLVRRRAGFSRCQSYRYWLWREFANGAGHCVFIGLNPSTGDADRDDPTIRRCMGFASDWGYQTMTVVNLFAFRTPEPAELKKAALPEGNSNRASLRRACIRADRIVAAWGTHGNHLNQANRLRKFFSTYELYCFGTTKANQPLHPLYQPKTARLTLYQPD